jgi:hypothetical protein
LPAPILHLWCAEWKGYIQISQKKTWNESKVLIPEDDNVEEWGMGSANIIIQGGLEG